MDALDTTLSTSVAGAVVTTTNPANALVRLGHGAIANAVGTGFIVAGGLGAGGAPLASAQTYTASASTGLVTSVSSAQNLATARARFVLVPAGLLNVYLAVGGTTATSASGDAPTASIERIADGANLAISTFGSLQAARQGEGAVQLPVAGASNGVFVVAGGGTAALGIEALIGP